MPKLSPPHVSVIMPVYNSERHLARSLESVINQTYRDLEIILVNDASPDGSLAICERFAARDPRIKIIDKKVNEGVDLARFAGLDAAQGEYVYFIDSDDTLSNKGLLEKMVHIADATEVDYVCMQYYRTVGKTDWHIRHHTNPQIGVVRLPELREKYYLSQFGWPLLSPNIWDKLYRKETLDSANLKPSGLKYGEDSSFNLHLFPYLKSIYLMDVDGYNYRYGGISAGYNPRFFKDQKKFFLMRKAEAEKNGFPQGARHAHAQLLAVAEAVVANALASLPEDEVREVFEAELKDPFWDELLLAEEYPGLFQTPFMKALAARDVNTMIELSKPAAKRQRRMAVVKKIANAILSRL